MKTIMNDKVYNVLKWVVVIVLPAAAALYNVLAATWGWAYADQISTTISAVNTFLGAVMMISSYQYSKNTKSLGGK